MVTAGFFVPSSTFVLSGVTGRVEHNTLWQSRPLAGDGFHTFFAKGAFGLDNASGKYILCGLAYAEDKGSEDVIKAAVFTEHNYHVLDRRDGCGRNRLRLADH